MGIAQSAGLTQVLISRETGRYSVGNGEAAAGEFLGRLNLLQTGAPILHLRNWQITALIRTPHS